MAALEAALALRDLAGDRVKLALMAPAPDFVYRAVAVLEPFARRRARHLPLAKFAAELNAIFEQDALASVDQQRRVLLTGRRREMAYDALVIAVGATTSEVLPGSISMDPSRMDESLHGLIDEIDSGAVRSLAFVTPMAAWPLPVYEVALLVRDRAREKNVDLDVTIITAEPRPLAVFGENVSAAVAALLAYAGIEIVVGAQVESSSGELIVLPSGRRLQFDRVVAVPRLQGPAIAGVPADADGFVPITPLCEVSGSERVYAAGDATDYPVKFGGIAAQQADTVAASIAALGGALTEPRPFDGIIHGTLQGGSERRRLYFTALMSRGIARDSRISRTPTCSPEAKIAARYLGPYLAELWGEGPRWLAGQVSGSSDA